MLLLPTPTINACAAWMILEVLPVRWILMICQAGDWWTELWWDRSSDDGLVRLDQLQFLHKILRCKFVQICWLSWFNGFYFVLLQVYPESTLRRAKRLRSHAWTYGAIQAASFLIFCQLAWAQVSVTSCSPTPPSRPKLGLWAALASCGKKHHWNPRWG